MEVKKITLSGVLVSLALVLSYIEGLFPFFSSVPGIKIGLANIAVIFALYKMGAKEALIVSVIRVLLSSVLFGSILSFSYSMAGALVSFCVMAFLKKTDLFSLTAVSIAGAVVHNVAQLAVAFLILKADVLIYYLPVLFATGIAGGTATGIISSAVVHRVDLN